MTDSQVVALMVWPAIRATVAEGERVSEGDVERLTREAWALLDVTADQARRRMMELPPAEWYPHGA